MSTGETVKNQNKLNATLLLNSRNLPMQAEFIFIFEFESEFEFSHKKIKTRNIGLFVAKIQTHMNVR